MRYKIRNTKSAIRRYIKRNTISYEDYVKLKEKAYEQFHREYLAHKKFFEELYG